MWELLAEDVVDVVHGGRAATSAACRGCFGGGSRRGTLAFVTCVATAVAATPSATASATMAAASGGRRRRCC